MCLTLNSDSEIKIAEEDIICYKILREDSEAYATSPYFGFEYIVGATYKLDKKLKIRSGDLEYEGDVKFADEGFHSFERFESAKAFLIIRQGFLPTGCCVYKCIIPKGTRMICGKFGDFSSIVSEAIIIIEKVQS